MDRKRYIIPYDTSKRGWGYAVINVRMKKFQEKDYEICKFAQPFIAVPNPELIYYTIQQNNDYYSIYVTVTQNFAQIAGDEKYNKPIPATIEAFTPEQEPQKIVTFCDIVVEKPKANMGFLVTPHEFYNDGAIVITADGKTKFSLDIWVETIIDGQVYRAPDENFIFRMAHNIPSDYLVCLNEKDATIPPKTSWQNIRPLVSSEVVQGTIAIDAYDANFQSNTPIGELRIPITLKPAKVAYKAEFSYELPAIYDKPLEITLLFYNDLDQQPISNAFIECCIKNPSGNPLGKVELVSNTTNDAGEVKAIYNLNSEIIYNVGCKLYDELMFYLVLDRNSNSKIEIQKPLFIPVAPKILLNLDAKKFGVNSTPIQNPIEISPEDVKGWELECCASLIDESITKENKKPIPINELELSLQIANTDKVYKIKTSFNGKFKFKLSEIKDAFTKAELQNQYIKFQLPNSEYEPNTVIFEINEEAKKLLDEYSIHLDKSISNLPSLSENLKEELKRYRYYFVENIAKIKADESQNLIASIKILGVALHGSKAYFSVFKGHENKIKDDFYKFINTLISFIAECINLTDYIKLFATRLYEKSVKLLKSLMETKLGAWISNGSNFLAKQLHWVFEQINDKLVDLFKGLWSLIQRAFNFIYQKSQNFINVINEFFDKAIKLCSGYVSKLSAAIQALLETASELTAEEWKQIKNLVDEKVSPKIINFASKLADFISSFLNTIIHFIETTAKAVISLIISLIEKGFQTAFKVFETALQSFEKFENETVKKVYNILRDKLKSIQDSLPQENLDTTPVSLGISKIIDFLIKDPLLGLFVDVLKNLNPLSLPEKIINLITQGYKHINIVLDLVFCAAKSCQVPSNVSSKVEDFKEKFMEYTIEYANYLNNSAFVDFICDVVGTVINIVTLLVILLGIIFTKGIIATYAPAIGQIISNVDKGFLALKAGFSDLPQLMYGLFYLMLIILRYDLLVLDLIFDKNSSGGSTV